jgi:hypothetical protein
MTGKGRKTNMTSHKNLGFKHDMPGITGADIEYVTPQNEQLELLRAAAVQRVEQASDVLAMATEGETPTEADATIKDLVDDAGSDLVDHRILPEDAEAAALVGLLQVRAGGTATAGAIHRAPSDMVEDPLRTLAEVVPDEELRRIVTAVDSAGGGIDGGASEPGDHHLLDVTEGGENEAKRARSELQRGLVGYEIEDYGDCRRRKVIVLDGEPPRRIAFTAIRELFKVADGTEVLPSSAEGVLELAQIMSGEPILPEIMANIRSHSIESKEKAILDTIATAVFQDNISVNMADSSIKVDELTLGNTERLAEVATAFAKNDVEVLTAYQQKLKDFAGGNPELKWVEAEGVFEGLDGIHMGYLEIDPTGLPEEVLRMASDFSAVRQTDNYRVDGPNVWLDNAATMTRMDKVSHNKNDLDFIPHETTHFTINHTVKSHLMGQFEGTLLVAGLDDMMRANGSPAALNGVDTYWASSPEEPTLMPNATVIKASHAPMDTPYSFENSHEITYKASGYVAEDIEKLIADIDRGTILIEQSGHHTSLLHFVDIIGEQVEHDREGVLMQAAQTGDITIFIQALNSVHDDMAAQYEEEQRDFDPDDRVAAPTPDELLSTAVSTLILRHVILKKKQKVVRGGEHYVDDKDVNDKLSVVAQELGLFDGLHAHSRESEIEAGRLDGKRFSTTRLSTMTPLLNTLRDSSFVDKYHSASLAMHRRSVVYDGDVPTVTDRRMLNLHGGV